MDAGAFGAGARALRGALGAAAGAGGGLGGGTGRGALRSGLEAAVGAAGGAGAPATEAAARADLAALEAGGGGAVSKDGLMLAEFGLRSLLREVLSGLEEGGEPPAGTWQPDLEAVFDFALELCQGGYAEPGLMFVLFEEAIKALTADGASQGGPGGPDAEWVFAYIERHVEALGRGPIFERGKLILLRTCNQLLRRFSQTRRASLCGRILMLLSKMLGMSERSGVNLLGRVHSDNVTDLDPDVLGGTAAAAGAGAGGAERVLLDREGVRIDVELYRAVWGLQRVFSDPLRVLRPDSDYPWGKVKTDLGAVLKAFEGTPLGGGGEETRANVDDTHAAKYLTSSKLFKLQMRDAVFRRHFLLQALIVLQCLQGPRRDVTATRDANLGKEARAEIDGLRERVLRAVESSGEGGAPFAEFLRRLQEREALWVKWKIASCPPIDKTPAPRTEATDRPDAGELPAALRAAGKRKRDAELERARKPRPMYFLPPGVEPVTLGHPDLDRLWNLSSDNASCLDFEDQATVPTLRDLMRPVVAQADPEEGVAGEDKVQNDKVFCWKALRQMARVDVAAFSKAGTSTLEAAIPALFPEDGRRLLEAGAVLGPEPLPEAGGQGSPMRESPPAEKLQGKHTRFSSPQKEGGADGEAEGPPVGDTDGSGSPMRDDDSQEARGKHTRFTSPVKGEVGPSDPEEGGVPGTE